MKWAIAQGWRQDNPAENIGQALPKQDRTQTHLKSLALFRGGGMHRDSKGIRRLGRYKAGAGVFDVDGDPLKRSARGAVGPDRFSRR